MKVTVYRFDPEVDQAPHYDTYDLPITAEDHYTVMDVLEYIFDHVDSSLSYYSHSVCNHGICGRCTVKINGKAGLACTTLASGEDFTLEPAGSRVVKDLVVER